MFYLSHDQGRFSFLCLFVSPQPPIGILNASCVWISTSSPNSGKFSIMIHFNNVFCAFQTFLCSLFIGLVCLVCQYVTSHWRAFYLSFLVHSTTSTLASSSSYIWRNSLRISSLLELLPYAFRMNWVLFFYPYHDKFGPFRIFFMSYFHCNFLIVKALSLSIVLVLLFFIPRYCVSLICAIGWDLLRAFYLSYYAFLISRILAFFF